MHMKPSLILGILHLKTRAFNQNEGLSKRAANAAYRSPPTL